MEKTIIYDNKIIELAVIQEGNWDIYYCKENKQFYYIAKKKGCGSGWFGDLYHIQNIKRRFGFSYIALTALGKELGIDKL